MIRTIRIVGVATLLAALFRLSQDVSATYGHEDVAGYSVALGVVALLFVVRAAATEYAGKKVHVGQRDILWGLSLGAFVSMLGRLLQ